MHFIFPSHPLKQGLVEPMFADQWKSIRSAGFSTSFISDSVIRDGKPIQNVPVGAEVIYRGWMLNAEEYQRLADAITSAQAKLFVSPTEYLAAHHCPNWYPLISDFTPETRIFPITADLEAELRALGWDQFFIKDYVKSLKTSRGSILNDPAEITEVVAEMKRIRGEIEGGICVRRVEDFIRDSELRYFVLRQKAFGADEKPVPPIVQHVAGKIPSPFYSIDVIRRKDGVLRVVEIGDGQVSDLVGWPDNIFADVCALEFK